jgi:beta-lactamase regulating signal transducer with metallopeptidase domain
MNAWLDIVLFNAFTATALALVVAVAGRRTKRPALIHALWLVVLLKLVSPPVLEVALVPRFAPARGLGPQERAAEETRSEAARTRVSPSRASAEAPSLGGARLGEMLLAVAVTGACAVLGVAIVRTIRFRRRVRGAREAPAELLARVASLVRRFGMTRVPRVRLVEERLSPSLWFPGRLEILLPAKLLSHLSVEECDALLAHEIAHIRRGDFCVRALELLVVSLYWWHPIVWWARRNLRAAEEKACDALVVEKLPQSARAYVEGLLKTVEFLATSGPRASTLTTANDVSNRLKERLTMILTAKPPGSLSLRFRAPVFAAAVATSLLSPAWSEPPAAAGEPRAVEETAILRDQLALEKELHQLERRRRQVQVQLEEARMQKQETDLRLQLQSLKEQHRDEEARALLRELARMEKDGAMRRKERDWEERYLDERTGLEFQHRELGIQRDQLIAQGQEGDALRVAERAKGLERQLAQLDLRRRREEIDRARRHLQQEMEELESVKSGR